MKTLQKIKIQLQAGIYAKNLFYRAFLLFITVVGLALYGILLIVEYIMERQLI